MPSRAQRRLQAQQRANSLTKPRFSSFVHTLASNTVHSKCKRTLLLPRCRALPTAKTWLSCSVYDSTPIVVEPQRMHAVEQARVFEGGMPVAPRLHEGLLPKLQDGACRGKPEHTAQE